MIGNWVALYLTNGTFDSLSLNSNGTIVGGYIGIRKTQIIFGALTHCTCPVLCCFLLNFIVFFGQFSLPSNPVAALARSKGSCFLCCEKNVVRISWTPKVITLSPGDYTF